MDAPDHTRCAAGIDSFTPARVEALRSHIREILETCSSLYESRRNGCDRRFAAPLPAIVTAEMMGLPIADAISAQDWSADFAEVLAIFSTIGSFAATLKCVEDMTAYFRDAIADVRANPRDGLIHALLTAEIRWRQVNGRRNCRELHRDDGWRSGNDDELDWQRSTDADSHPEDSKD